MMSFLRRLALKSVMAAKKESVAKCAGPLQYDVGRPDGANTMIKTIHYLADADPTRVLVTLDLKAAFQNVSRRAMLNSIEYTDPDLAAVCSKWYTGDTEHRMHLESSHTKITANSDPVLRFALADFCRLLDDGAKLFAYLDDWYLWIKPQCLNDALVLISAATRSANLELQPSKLQVWRASCLDPVPQPPLPPLLLTPTRSNPHPIVSQDTFKFRETAGPVL